MTEARIYSLAYDRALILWSNLDEKLKKHPDNLIYQHREKEAWKELNELRAIISRKGLLHEV